jgi:hypothetical protein
VVHLLVGKLNSLFFRCWKIIMSMATWMIGVEAASEN